MTNLFNNFKLPTVKKGGGGERGEIIGNLFKLYQEDSVSRKKDNWVRYVKYLKHYHLADTPKEQAIFKKTRGTDGFIPEYKIGSFCYLLSHIKKDDLYPLLSVAKDNKARGFNVSGYIASHFSKGVIK